MKGLTIWQPWASLITVGAKQFETRDWYTAHRGLLAIHAAKQFGSEERATCDEEPFALALRRGGLGSALALPLGAIVAVATLVAVHRAETLKGLHDQEREFGDFSHGRFAWQLAYVRRLDAPIPCRGAQGLWDVPDDVARALMGESGEATNG